MIRFKNFRSLAFTGAIAIGSLALLFGYQNATLSNKGTADLLWQNLGDGSVSYWSINSNTLIGGGTLPYASSADNLRAWRLVTTADINGDGKPDTIWQNNQNGSVYYWIMDGLYSTTSGYLPGTQTGLMQWQLVTTADLNGDGKPDLIWQNKLSGVIAYWYMDGVTYKSGGQVPGSENLKEWTLAAVSDLSGDGKPDILLQNKRDGSVYYWQMSGPNVIGGHYLGTTGLLPWRLASAHDMNADGKNDLVWQHKSNGSAVVWYMNGLQFSWSSGIVHGGSPVGWRLANISSPPPVRLITEGPYYNVYPFTFALELGGGNYQLYWNGEYLCSSCPSGTKIGQYTYYVGAYAANAGHNIYQIYRTTVTTDPNYISPTVALNNNHVWSDGRDSCTALCNTTYTNSDPYWWNKEQAAKAAAAAAAAASPTTTTSGTATTTTSTTGTKTTTTTTTKTGADTAKVTNTAKTKDDGVTVWTAVYDDKGNPYLVNQYGERSDNSQVASANNVMVVTRDLDGRVIRQEVMNAIDAQTFSIPGTKKEIVPLK